MFYQYVRTAALNQQQQTQHVSVFTTELFAHYLHMRCLSITKSRQLTQTSLSLTEEVQRYQKCVYGLQEIFTTDLLVFKFVSRAKYPTNNKQQVVVSSPTMPVTSHQLDTSELVELLQRSAVEHLTSFRQLEAQDFVNVTTDFEALCAYKCSEYQRCLRLSTDNVCTLIGVTVMPCVGLPAYPEFIQLMDDDIVSLIGLTVIVNPSCRENANYFNCDSVHQLYLSLYLMTQCQVKLHHSVTSLAQTLDCVEVAREHLCEFYILDQLLLKLTERKILLYISGQLDSYDTVTRLTSSSALR